MTDNVRQSIERLKAFEPEDGYILAFSGGKDSVVIKALADMAGVNYHARYNVTSVDPPELVQFVKAQKDVEMSFPRDDDGKRRVMEVCSLRNDITVNPIVDWTDEDVWAFIHREGVPYCELYDEGFSRLGCVGCPMAGRKGRLREFARWPRYVTLYKRAIARMLDTRERKGLKRIWDSVDDAWNWWLEEPVGRGQMTLGLEEDCDTIPTD